MTVQQVSKILRMISAAYPNYRSQYDEEMMKDATDVWSVLFKDDDYTLVSAAVYSYMSQSNAFAPNPGQIKDIMYGMTHQNDLTEGEAWSLVFQAIKRKGSYDPKGAFESLPEQIQRVIGSSMYLHELAISENVNFTVEQSLFTKRYKEFMQRQRDLDVLPNNVRAYVDSKAGDRLQLTDRQKEEAERDRQLIEMHDRAIEEFLHGESDYFVSQIEADEEEPGEEQTASLQSVKERLTGFNFARKNEDDSDFQIPEEIQTYADETGINLSEIPKDTIKALDLGGNWQENLETLLEFYYPQAKARASA